MQLDNTSVKNAIGFFTSGENILPNTENRPEGVQALPLNPSEQDKLQGLTVGKREYDSDNPCPTMVDCCYDKIVNNTVKGY